MPRIARERAKAGSWGVLFTAILFGLGLMFVYAARRTIIAFIFAIFFAYLLEAPVARVERQ